MKSVLFKLLLAFTVCFFSIIKYSSAQVNAVYSFLHVLPTSSWLKVGTFSMATTPQMGETVGIKFYGGLGFNANNGQNATVELFLRTGNGGSLDPNGYSFSAFASRFGNLPTFVSDIRIIPNAAGGAATSFDVYIYIASQYPGKGYYHVTTANGTWTNTMTAVAAPTTGYVVPFYFKTLSDTYLGNNSMVVSAVTGNVGIGVLAPEAKLAVKGDIVAQKVKVTQTGWADFVFEHDYQLPSIQELDKFIRENKHLPGVPSAKEVITEGLDLGGNQAVLLQKIEELSLYIIEQNKRLDKQEKEIAELKSAIKK